jgi:hypothetical protein
VTFEDEQSRVEEEESLSKLLDTTIFYVARMQRKLYLPNATPLSLLFLK